MKKNLILTAFLLISGYLFAMEEREKPIDPKILGPIAKLPENIGQQIKEMLTLEALPADLLLPILIKFTAGNTLEESLKAMKQFRLISRRFNELIKDEAFFTSMVNYWSEKYKVPRSYIPVAWSFTLQDIPDELLMSVLSQLATGKYLKDEIDAINKLRLVSKRFDKLINDIKFVDDMIKYWSEKYNIPPAFVAVFWNIPGVLEWAKLQDKSEFDIELKEIFKHFEEDTDISPASPLILSIRFNNLKLIPILVKKGVDINKRVGIGITPLIEAIGQNSEVAVKILLENGADPNLATSDGVTPLGAAISVPSYNLMKLLLEKGVDPNVKTTYWDDVSRRKYSGKPMDAIDVARRDIGSSLRGGYLVNDQELELYDNPEKFIDLLKKYGAKE